MELFYSSREKLGALSEKECYGAVPIEAFGGLMDVEHMKKVLYMDYLHLIIQAGGCITS